VTNISILRPTLVYAFTLFPLFFFRSVLFFSRLLFFPSPCATFHRSFGRTTASLRDDALAVRPCRILLMIPAEAGQYIFLVPYGPLCVFSSIFFRARLILQIPDAFEPSARSGLAFHPRPGISSVPDRLLSVYTDRPTTTHRPSDQEVFLTFLTRQILHLPLHFSLFRSGVFLSPCERIHVGAHLPGAPSPFSPSFSFRFSDELIHRRVAALLFFGPFFFSFSLFLLFFSHLRRGVVRGPPFLFLSSATLSFLPISLDALERNFLAGPLGGISHTVY